MPPLERTKPADRAARLRGTLFLGALVAALVPSAVDCGGSGDDNDVAGGSGFNCVDAFGARCGAACVSDMSCGVGLFCSNGVCTAQCTATSGCEAGRVCSTQGRCVPISTGGSGGASGAGGSGLPGTGGTGGAGAASGAGGAAGGGNCPDVSVEFRPIIPTVMILADRSASMVCPITSLAEVVGQCQGEANPTSPGSRWQSFKGPLLDLVEEVQSQVIFGSAFYPADDACSVDGIVLPVGLKLDNFDAIKTGYDNKTPGGDTPTSLAVDEAVKFINAATDLPKNSPKFLILASDGSPNCTLEESQAATVAALGAAFDGGIKTFVIAIGGIFETNSIKKAQFQALADAGAGVGKLGGAAEGKLYPISNRDALTAALKTIITGVRPCSFDLDVALTDPAVDGPKGEVTIDGASVPYNDPNGWKLTDNNTIEFVGAACDSIKGGSTDVKAAFPCEVETTPVPPPPPPPR